MATIRDKLLRRKAWSLVVQGFCYFSLLLAVPVAARIPSNGWTQLKIALFGSLAAFLALYLSLRWVRCPRCAYNLTRISLRRKEKLQVNVCAHCGLGLDEAESSR